MKLYSGWVVVVALLLSQVPSAGGAPARVSGIYLTATDYTSGQLTAEGDCASKAHKLELHDLLDKPYIHVTHQGEKRRYAKSELFGFRACDGNTYRFASSFEYRILEAGGLYIYSRETHVTVGKSRQVVTEYSFSAGLDTNIILLTLQNLKLALPNNHAFHDSLDQMFGVGQDLTQYDEFHKMYKVNRLLLATQTPESRDNHGSR